MGAEEGLSEEKWESLHDENGVVADDREVYRLVYFGGCQHSIRKKVWPYLLGHYRLIPFHFFKDHFYFQLISNSIK